MEFIQHILGEDIEGGLLIILNLILIESLLSVDNAAVLATMVMDLPKEQRSKALRFGIVSAYVFRGVCLLLASELIKIWWLKPLGGLYLLYLAFDYFRTKSTPQPEDDTLNKEGNWFYRKTIGLLGNFWATVALVELMDLAFSLDNVFAAVAFTDNIYLIWIGVFIGILAMRFVANGFVRLMEKFPFLGTSAFIVIGILGLKLASSVITHFYPDYAISHFLESEKADIAVSISTVACFLIPVLTSVFLGVPKHRE